MPPPGTPRTVVHRLRDLVEASPERPLYSQIDRNLQVTHRFTYHALWHAAVSGARRLRLLAARGDRVVIFFEPGIEPLVPFWACLVAGLIAVPTPMPARLEVDATPDTAARLGALLNLLKDSEPTVLVVPTARLAAVERALADTVPRPRLLPLESFCVLAGATPPANPMPELPDSDEIAFLQYTSGSTANPKGVVVTHANLVHNQIGIERALHFGHQECLVSWLPMFHDMGLIGDALQSCWCGGHNVKLLPADFLRRPGLWMQAVDAFRATLTGGPNFAFGLAAAAAERLPRALDLSCLRTLYCGSEPIRAASLARMASAYAPHGLRAEAILPCYGMAEHTLLVSGLKPPATYRCRAPGTPASAEPAVSCGAVPWSDATLQIHAPGSSTPLPEGTPGEIVLSSRSASPGYWSELGRRPDRHPDQVRQLRTGDIGFLADGELHILGRIKNTIILHGRKLVAEDIEAALERRLAHIRSARVAAFQVRGDESDPVVLAVEGRFGPNEHGDKLRELIEEASAQDFGFRPDAVVLVRPSSLPRTTSGKLQRQRAAELWRQGKLAVAVPMPAGEEIP